MGTSKEATEANNHRLRDRTNAHRIHREFGITDHVRLCGGSESARFTHSLACGRRGYSSLAVVSFFSWP